MATSQNHQATCHDIHTCERTKVLTGTSKLQLYMCMVTPSCTDVLIKSVIMLLSLRLIYEKNTLLHKLGIHKRTMLHVAVQIHACKWVVAIQKPNGMGLGLGGVRLVLLLRSRGVTNSSVSSGRVYILLAVVAHAQYHYNIINKTLNARTHFSHGENIPCLNTAATRSTRAANADFPIVGCSRIVFCLVFSCGLCTTL